MGFFGDATDPANSTDRMITGRAGFPAPGCCPGAPWRAGSGRAVGRERRAASRTSSMVRTRTNSTPFRTSSGIRSRSPALV